MRSNFVWIGTALLAIAGAVAAFLIINNTTEPELTEKQKFAQQITESVENARGKMRDVGLQDYGDALNSFGLSYGIADTFYNPDGTQVPEDKAVVGQYVRTTKTVLIRASYYEETKTNWAMNIYVNFFLSHEVCHHVTEQAAELLDDWRLAEDDELNERVVWACAEALYFPSEFVGEIGKYVPAKYVPTDSERMYFTQMMDGLGLPRSVYRASK